MDLKEMNPLMVRRHPWETMRLSFFTSILKKKRLLTPKRILDVGSGDAFFAQGIHQSLYPNSFIVCLDINYKEEHKTEHFEYKKTWPQEKFDLVMLMDVLEHVEDDQKFLTNIVQTHASSGTYFLISVPAFPSLFSLHDKKLGHYRRYKFQELKNIISGAQLEFVSGGGFFFLLLFPRFLSKYFEKILSLKDSKTADLGQWNKGPIITKIINLTLVLDNNLARLLSALRVHVPGLSLWILAKKIRVN